MYIEYIQKREISFLFTTKISFNDETSVLGLELQNRMIHIMFHLIGQMNRKGKIV